MTLADTDRLSYQLGDTMSFNVIIENTSTARVVLGISRDPDIAPKMMSPCRVVPPGVHFSANLVAMTKKGQEALITGGFGFYGSLNVPGTTLVLQPGERARVQVPGKISPGPDIESVLTTDWPQHAHIKALVMIDGESIQPEYSDNALEIELTRRLPRD